MKKVLKVSVVVSVAILFVLGVSGNTERISDEEYPRVIHEGTLS